MRKGVHAWGAEGRSAQGVRHTTDGPLGWADVALAGATRATRSQGTRGSHVPALEAAV